MLNLHEDFLKKHPHLRVSYSFWCNHRPFYIVQKDISTRDTCCCTMCLNMSLLIQSPFRIKVIEEKDSSPIISSFCCQDKTAFYAFVSIAKKKVEFRDQDRYSRCHYFKWTSQKDTYFDYETKKKKL